MAVTRGALGTAVLAIVPLLWPVTVAAQTPRAASTRLFMAPTGRVMLPGQVSVSGYGLFIPAIQFGVSRRVSVGAGTLPVPVGASSWPFWVSGKVQVYAGERTQVAAGMLTASILSSGVGGFAYVASTTGTEDRSYTIGALVGFVASDDGSGVSLPLVQVGGERRLGRRVTFVTENFIGRDGALLMSGVRLERGGFSLDLGGGVVIVGAAFIQPAVTVNWGWRF